MNRRHFMAAIGGVVAGAVGLSLAPKRLRIYKARSQGISTTAYPECGWWQSKTKHPMLSSDVDKWANMCRRYMRQFPHDGPVSVLCLESNYERRKAMLT